MTRECAQLSLEFYIVFDSVTTLVIIDLFSSCYLNCCEALLSSSQQHSLTIKHQSFVKGMANFLISVVKLKLKQLATSLTQTRKPLEPEIKLPDVFPLGVWMAGHKIILFACLCCLSYECFQYANTEGRPERYCYVQWGHRGLHVPDKELWVILIITRSSCPKCYTADNRGVGTRMG